MLGKVVRKDAGQGSCTLFSNVSASLASSEIDELSFIKRVKKRGS